MSTSVPRNNPRRNSTPETLEGMPGYICTKASKEAKGDQREYIDKRGVGPKKEGPIGERGRARNEERIYSQGGTGTHTKSYRAVSTAKAEGIHGNSRENDHLATAHRPKIGGHHDGKSAVHHADQHKPHGHVENADIMKGHPGRMESMSGRAKTHAEGRRKSRMY